MASKKQVTGWYAELQWIDKIITEIAERWELDADDISEFEYCKKRIRKLQLVLLREGMKGVNQKEIVSTFLSRTPQSFKFNTLNENKEG